MRNLYKQLIAIISAFIFIPIFFIPTFSSSNINTNNTDHNYEIFSLQVSENGFVWPTPRIY